MPGHRISRALVFHCDIVPTATFVARGQTAPTDHGLRATRSRLPPQTTRRLHPHLRVRVASEEALQSSRHEAQPLRAPRWAADCFRNRAGHLCFLDHSNRIGPPKSAAKTPCQEKWGVPAIPENSHKAEWFGHF